MSGKERFHSIELAPELVRAYAQIFIPRWDCYHLQLPDGTYALIPKPLTMTDVFRHLTESHVRRNPHTIGTYMLDTNSQGNKLCFDADTPEHWQELLRLAAILEQESIPVYPERSARGGHLWLFTPLLTGAEMRRFGRQFLKAYEISPYGEDKKAKIELYPKQDTVGDGVGSFMRLPLGMHLATKKVYEFITADGRPLAPTIREQIALLGTPNRIPVQFIEAVLAQAPAVEEQLVSPTPPFKKRKPRYNEPLSESIKHAIPVSDFVSRYVELDHSGKGHCPFHDDQKKSFHVNRERNYWHCHAGCFNTDGNKGGSIIDFWMLWRERHGQDGSFKATILDLRDMLLKQ